MAFYETFNLTIDDEIVDPSGYAQGDIQTTYAGTATTITQTHIVDGYKILIEFDDDFGDNVDLYLEGSKVISSRAVIGKDHIAEAGDLSVESIVVNVGKDYEGGFKVVSYQGDTGETIGNVASLINDDNIRYCTLAGFCNTNVGAPNYASAGVIGVGYTETTSINPAIGVRGRGVSTNVQDCAGGIFDAETATGSNTYAVYAKASGGSVANYSFYGGAGTMYNLGNVNFAAVCAADTFRLASGKYIGYSAAVGTAPTGGLMFDNGNNAIITTSANQFAIGNVSGINRIQSSNTGVEISFLNTGNGLASMRAGNVNFSSIRLPSGGYVGYSAAVGTAPTGGVSFNTSNNATFTGNVYAPTATMGTATSYTQISAEGLKYFGDATTWDDLQFPVATGKVPAANFPDYEALTTNTQAFAFEVGEYIDLQANEPSHGWKEGTSAEFHLHIATKSAIAGESAARFEIIIAHATPTGVFIETSLSANYSFSDPLAKQHFYVDIGSLPLTGYLIGTQLLCRVKRVAETTAFSEYGDEIFITQVGAHLEYDSTGSRTESAK
jgi:hypothetical protein